jgi:nicotinamide-nucleotide amidase
MLIAAWCFVRQNEKLKGLLMIAEILATGDELCSGAGLDTNSAHIASKLTEIGVEVARHTCVGDHLNLLVQTFSVMGERATTVIVTGGLGPTSDDLTAEAAAKAAGCRLKLDAQGWQAIETRLNQRGFAILPMQKKQAMLPEGSKLIQNPVGIAPGFEMKIGKSRFFFLPGPPREMKPMLAEGVLPRIFTINKMDKQQFQIKTISCFGLGESAVAENLSDFSQKYPALNLGFRVKFPEIQIKLYGRGNNSAKTKALIIEAADWVASKLGPRILSLNGESMQMVVGQLLRQQKTTIALAESCTGGLIAHMLTGVPGSSDYFIFSAVTYANQAKKKVLGVSPETLLEHGAVSDATAIEMAHGARQVVDADYGLAVTGIAGPGGGSPKKPVGTVWVGLSTRNKDIARRFDFKFDDRDLNKNIFAVTALDVLRQRLMDG